MVDIVRQMNSDREFDPEAINRARAVLGQGLGMGWGDEAEAWLRSKLGQGSYEQNLEKVRSDYARYSKQNPMASGALELAGGAAPGVAAMMLPGGQPAGAAQLQRSTLGSLGRLGLIGAGTGAISGAGTAREGERGAGAATGATIGGVLGVAAPPLLRGASAASKWLLERARPTEARIAENAASKFNRALSEGDMTPAQMQAQRQADVGMGVPSVLANANPALADLAEAVAQRTGRGAKNIENTLLKQKLGARERTHQQVVKGLNPGDYYADLEAIQKDLSTKASPHYKAAYATGEVTDPEVLKFMALPQFKQAVGKANELLAAEGRKMPTLKITDPVTGEVTEKMAPTVEVLDQVKRGLDTLIEAQTDPLTGKTTSLGRVYVTKKNEFLNALDNAVPEYAQARSIYKGDAELADAMRKGINEFNKMDHEQVIKLVGGMSDAEKQAFRTGVARDLYDKVMKPSGNFNAAQRIIGAPEMQAKLQPLFDNPAQFDLFKNTMEREAQLFNQSSKILGGSPTARRLAAASALDEGDGIGEAIGKAVTGGWKSSLANAVMTGLRKGQMSDKTAEKLSTMLMSKDPHEVAAVVRLLEEQAASAGPQAARATAVEAGMASALPAAIVRPAALSEPGSSDIERDITFAVPAEPEGPDLEADIEAASKPK